MSPEITPAEAVLGCRVHVVSVRGPVRAENQDAAAAWHGDHDEVVLILADGMGGHTGGREAAEIVVRSALEAIRDRGAVPWSEVLENAIGAAHRAVLGAARTRTGSAGGGRPVTMGATAIIAVVEAASTRPCVHLAHVGDSRAYLYRGASLVRLTADHSLVGRLVQDGLLSEEESFGHPDTHVLQRAIGQSGPLSADLRPALPLAAGDLVMLCTDGLHGAVPDAEIERAMEGAESARQSCERLLGAALAANSQDNITVGCLRVEADHPPRRPTRPET
ncbi:MAG TPA: protein phosphatase 2C domain-containing protein [Thermoanaerobaculia bacterium]|nr:protein phosphatase 2C domain-containing protein [Thermoanaerobaculia bacterium]